MRFAGPGKARNEWKAIRGPASAVLASLHRLGWTWPAPHVLLVDGMGGLDLRKVAPMTIRHIMQRTMEFRELSRWAAQRQLPGIRRPFLDPVRAALRRKGMTLQRKAAIKAYVGADFWTQDKLRSRGCSTTRACQACGAGVGDQQHRFCRCPNTQGEREALRQKHSAILLKAEAGAHGHPLWSRCLADHPIEDPNGDVQEYTRVAEGEELAFQTGLAYTDGSGKGVGRLKGYGWGFVYLDDRGSTIGRVSVPFPGCGPT